MNWLDPRTVIASVGLLGVAVVLFAECGLFCFFLPGDTLLFTAGLLAAGVGAGAGTRPELALLLLLLPLAAAAGAQLGHLLGARYGRRLQRHRGRVLRPERLDRARHYLHRFGPAKAIVLARFVPVVRTFLNPAAGILGVPWRRFLVWNAVGAIVWADGIVLLGYVVGPLVPGIDRYLLPGIAVVVVLSVVLPLVVGAVRRRRHDRHAVDAS